jgi:hypothetical protein
MFVVLVATLCWSLWAQAQPATNVPAPPAATAATNAPAEQVWLTFGLDRIAPLRYAPFAGIPLWQYLASLIYIFLAFYVSKTLDALIMGRVKEWAEKTATKLDDLLIEVMRGPVKIIAFVILLHIGMQVYRPDVLEDFFSKSLKIVIAVSVTYVLLKAIDALVGVWRSARPPRRTNSSAGNCSRSSARL